MLSRRDSTSQFSDVWRIDQERDGQACVKIAHQEALRSAVSQRSADFVGGEARRCRRAAVRNDVGDRVRAEFCLFGENGAEFHRGDEREAIGSQCGRSRCICFNGNSNDSSDDEFDFYSGFGDSIPVTLSADSLDMLKSLIPCASGVERNLLADTSKIVEKNKTCKRKDDLRKIVLDALLFLGYDSSICKSRWENSLVSSGGYEYIDVIVQGDRVLIDIDFRSEFEIARSTEATKRSSNLCRTFSLAELIAFSKSFRSCRRPRDRA
ncbi:hypothetical protein U1Q18_046799 [Sarracenia purpurea var. burkii]